MSDQSTGHAESFLAESDHASWAAWAEVFKVERSFGVGLMVAATGGDRSANPHQAESADWQEWLRGFQAWSDAIS